MPRGKKGSGKKSDKFDSLSPGFKEAVAGMGVEEIRKRISDITLLDLEMRKLLKEDEKVLSAKEVLKNLMQPYRDDFKSYKLQIEYCKSVLEDKNGGATTAKAEEVVKAGV
jgi:hypothetical protein